MIRVVPTSSLVPNAKPTYIEESKVTAYRKLLREGSRQPPILVSKLPGNRFSISDGHHRHRARLAKGWSETEVVVVNDLVVTDEHGGNVIQPWR
jgi:ParB-like chromosome segregation protein Spo0J